MNLPNKITIIRLVMIPLMVFAFYAGNIFPGFYYAGLAAAVLFVVASFTDCLDGYLARKYNLVTNMGKFLDPIADKVLVVTALFLIVGDAGLITEPFGAIAASVIVARELIISGFRQIAAANGVIISADKTGKIKAVFQDIAMAMFLFLKTYKTIGGGSLLTAYEAAAYAVLTIALILTVWSGISYIIKNKKVIIGNK